MSKKLAMATALIAMIALPVDTFAAGGGGAGGSGAAAGASGGTGGMSGTAGSGNTSTGIGASTGASSINTPAQPNRSNATTTGQVNDAISPSNPATTAPGGPNSQPVPSQTVQEQNPQQFDPRLTPGYQK